MSGTKKVALETVTDSVGWWSPCTRFVHALSREVEHQENLASSPALGVKLD